MKRVTWMFPVLLLLGCQPPPADITDDDVAALRQAVERYVQTSLAGEWDAWTALSSDDAVFLQPNGPAIEGRTALRAWIEGFRGMESFTATPIDIHGRGDLAYVRGTYAFALGPAAAVQMADNGKWVTIYRKQDDGSWRIVRNIWNSNEPVPQ